MEACQYGFVLSGLGIEDRRSVHEPFATGIIGDRQTGKTTAAVDAILNQTDVLCVYVAVGQKNSTVAEMLSSLATQKDLSTVVVVSSIHRCHHR